MFNSGQTYDFIVKKVSDETEVWKWSDGRFFSFAFSEMVFDPLEIKTFKVIWDQIDSESKRAEPGTYKIEALISSEPEIFAIPMEIVTEEFEGGPFQ